MAATSNALRRSSQPLYPIRYQNFLWKFRERVVFRPDSLMKAASRRTGLTDWGPDPFEEALGELCTGLNDDRKMHAAGRLMALHETINFLADRLEIQDTLKRNPEILDLPISKPILIPGEARAGTTFLHRLLAVDPCFRAPRSWELYFPVPPPDPDTHDSDPRIADADAIYRRIYKVSPGLDVVHPMGGNLPEECWHLLGRSFVGIRMLVNDLPGYSRWLAFRSREQRLSAYRFYRKQLQLLQSRFPARRWLLKAPRHSRDLPAFVETFPDVTLIHCHREPIETVPSSCTLMALVRSAYYDYVDLRAIGEEVLSGKDFRTDRPFEFHQQIGSDRVIDVSFKSLRSAPMETVRSIYSALGLELHPETERRMKIHVATSKKGKHTRHRYTLEDFGLDKAMINKVFEAYRDRFQQYL